VVGCGPAGIYLAAHLASKGLNVGLVGKQITHWKKVLIGWGVVVMLAVKHPSHGGLLAYWQSACNLSGTTYLALLCSAALAN
jgi:heterodisulfide reductase subunit A-like polyferredoxin